MTLAELRPRLTTMPERPGLDPVPNLLLQRGLGLLPEPRRLLDRLEDGEYEVCIDSTLDGRITDLRRGLSRGRERRRGADLDPRLPSVALQRQPLRNRGRGLPGPHDRLAAAAALVPVRVRSGHDRRDRLARSANQATASTDQARSRPRLRRRPGPRDVQASRDAATPRSTGRSRTSCAQSGDDYELLDFSPDRLRRAAVLLARLRSARRLLHADAARAVPRVPHVGRRPRPRHARTAWPTRSGSCLAVLSVVDGNTTLRQPQPDVRAPARPARASTARPEAGRTRASTSWRCSGC